MATNSADIRQHLDFAAGQGYLDAINGTTPESLVDAQSKVRRLWEQIEYATDRPVLSIGVGQGEELHALKSLNPAARIMGFDLSDEALERTKIRSDTYDLSLELKRGDARQLPYKSGLLGGVVMSAVLHEVYSYCQPEGFDSVALGLNEATRALSDGGVLYVREFTSPTIKQTTRLEPLTESAGAFYSDFVERFNTGIGGVDGDDRIAVDIEGNLPVSGSLTQILMHFRNYWNDMTKGVTRLGDPEWKEGRESYVIKDPRAGNDYLDPDQLAERIPELIDPANGVLELVDKAVLPRKKVNLFLAQHFMILDTAGNDITQRVLPQVTSKAEILYKKVSQAKSLFTWQKQARTC